MSKSPAWALEVATVDAVNADSALAARGVMMKQDGSHPKSPNKPYITSGAAGERETGTFGDTGHTSTRTWGIWAKTKQDVLEVYAELSRVVEDTSLTVAGHAVLYGEVSLITTLRDPESGLMHGVVRFECVTERA